MKFESLDIFCNVIDNFGDIGVVYRIAKELRSVYPEKQMRLILNRLDELTLINNEAQNIDVQSINGITFIRNSYFVENIQEFGVADIILETFGCDIPEKYVERAYDKSKLWINVDYLSAEEWVEDFHLQQSMLPSKMLKKFFFMPGFTEKTGGVIVDSNFVSTKKSVEADRELYCRKHLDGYPLRSGKIGTVFTYEKNFTPLLETLASLENCTTLLVMGEKSQESFLQIFGEIGVEALGESFYRWRNIDFIFMPFLSQEEYEELVNIADFNFVRGEDSFIRALVSGKPFLWHAYLQEDMAHMDKVKAFTATFSKQLEEVPRKDVLDQFCRGLESYNYRSENSLKKGPDNYDNFFKNFTVLEEICGKYCEFLVSKCNLINNLYNFIEKH